MYVTTQFPELGLPQFPLSAPEYLEFREVNRSFAAIGAFSPGAGEVNLTADRRSSARAFRERGRASARRARPAGCPGTVVRPRRNRQERSCSTAAAGRDSLARVVANRVWRTADRREDGGSEQPASRSDRHHAAWRRCHGYPAGDLAAAGVEPVQPRGSPRSPPACDRPVERRRHGGGSPERN